MRTRLFVSSVIVLAIAAIVVGCGDDGEDSSPASNTSAASDASTAETNATTSPAPSEPVTTASMSKAAVVKEAKAACAQTRKGLSQEQEAYIEEHVEDEGVEQGELLANMTREVLVPRIEAENEALRKTGAPAGDEQQIEAILTAQQEGVEELAGLKEIEANEELEAPFAKAAKLRKAYGFPVCSYIP